MVSLETIQALCSGRIAINEPLGPMTSFRIGGRADFYIEPARSDELAELVSYLRAQTFPFIVIGNGSNILVSDQGFRGAVLNLEKHFSHIRMEEGFVSAGAGIRMAAFVDFCIQQQLAGTEMLAGIPGTLGGAIVMNAGAYGGEISDRLAGVTVVRDNALISLSKAEAGFGYRRSGLQGDVIVEARFALERGDPELLAGRRRTYLQERNAAQPVRLPNAGSIFKNPEGDFAGRLIEEAGLKGFQIGGAQVSLQHANFIVNLGNATAADVIAVMIHVRRVVEQRHGRLLEPEIKLIGFEERILEQPPARMHD